MQSTPFILILLFDIPNITSLNIPIPSMFIFFTLKVLIKSFPETVFIGIKVGGGNLYFFIMFSLIIVIGLFEYGLFSLFPVSTNQIHFISLSSK